MRKRIKYETGGTTSFADTTGGSALSNFGALGGSLIAGLDARDGELSRGGAFASGAMTGAASGVAFGPWGAAIGGVLGGLGSFLGNEKVRENNAMMAAEKAEAEAEAERIRLEEQRMRQDRAAVQKKMNMENILAQYPVEGTYTPRFAMGGMTLGPQYEAEGGEMIQYKPGDMPRTYGNGGVTMVTGTEGEIKGPSHAQGGVDMSDEKGARIYSDKLTVDAALMSKLMKL